MRPQQDEVHDMFIQPWKQVIDRCFYDPEPCDEYQRFSSGEFQEFGGPREAGRSMSIRMCFRAFMYDPALPGMLGKIWRPALVVWGAQDAIIPVECGRLYQQGSGGSTLRLLERCSGSSAGLSPTG